MNIFGNIMAKNKITFNSSENSINFNGKIIRIFGMFCSLQLIKSNEQSLIVDSGYWQILLFDEYKRCVQRKISSGTLDEMQYNYFGDVITKHSTWK